MAAAAETKAANLAAAGRAKTAEAAATTLNGVVASETAHPNNNNYTAQHTGAAEAGAGPSAQGLSEPPSRTKIPRDPTQEDDQQQDIED